MTRERRAVTDMVLPGPFGLNTIGKGGYLGTLFTLTLQLGIPGISLAVGGLVFGYLRWIVVAYYLGLWFDERLRLGVNTSQVTRSLISFREIEKRLNISLIRTAELAADQTYIFGAHPHGVFGFGGAAPVLTGRRFLELFPGIDARVSVVSFFFTIPLVREISIHSGLIPASREAIVNHLKTGHSVFLIPGGAAEVMLTGISDSATYTIVKDRLGFVQIAHEMGSSLVPVIAFGEHKTYDVLHSPGLQGVQERIRNITGISMPILAPNFPVPYVCRPASITVVFGAPIPCSKLVKGDRNFMQTVLETHGKYCDALVALHAKYAPTFGDKSEQQLKLVSSAEARHLVAGKPIDSRANMGKHANKFRSRL